MLQQLVLLGVLSLQGIESFSPSSNSLLKINVLPSSSSSSSSSYSSDPLPRRRRNINGFLYNDNSHDNSEPYNGYSSTVRTRMVKEGIDLLTESKTVNDSNTSTTSSPSPSTSSTTKELFFCQEEASTPLQASTTTAASSATTQEELSLPNTTKDEILAESSESSSFSYGEFAKQYPFINNVAIATTKTGAADFIAQTVIGGTPLYQLDVERSILFMTFGAVYSGGFQWLYQVNVFKKLFDIEKFTNLSIQEKLEDKEGLKQLMLQTALDLTVLTLVYLPAFYIFKAGVFSGSMDPNVWTSTGMNDYMTNFAKDEADLLKVWFPADLVCFSVPLYLRLPVRHSVSFLWTAYLSFARGGH